MNKKSIAPPAYTEDDWVQLRAHFMGSILVDVHLHKLAKNMGASWPRKQKDETPAKYLEYSFEELSNAPGLVGYPSRVRLLLDILKETASFDDPFQDMMEAKPSLAGSSKTTDELLEKLGIPPAFPLKFTNLSAETKELCVAENALTVGQCASLFQKMAQCVILGGEVRQFLNSLACVDELSLCHLLPLRPGTRGPRLAETFVVLLRNLPEAQRVACLAPASGNEDSFAKAVQEFQSDLSSLQQWFPDEVAELIDLAASAEPIERFFHPVGDAALEKAAARIAAALFAKTPPASTADNDSHGFMGRITGFFKSG